MLCMSHTASRCFQRKLLPTIGNSVWAKGCNMHPDLELSCTSGRPFRTVKARVVEVRVYGNTPLVMAPLQQQDQYSDLSTRIKVLTGGSLDLPAPYAFSTRALRLPRAYQAWHVEDAAALGACTFRQFPWPCHTTQDLSKPAAEAALLGANVHGHGNAACWMRLHAG